MYCPALQRRKEMKHQLNLPEDYGIADSDGEHGACRRCVFNRHHSQHTHTHTLLASKALVQRGAE
jgi:hypothetical protein